VITRQLAVELARRGLPWHPAAGDRFHVPDRDLDEEVFVVSGMSIEIADLPSGTEMRFNGTVEWALDSIEHHDVVWLPRESQLRELLGESFVRLEAVPPGAVVEIETATGPQRHADVEPERAYARALLATLGGA
jgi:hypothetical protein